MKPTSKEYPAWFHRFDAVWTPTLLLLGSEGKERVRLEGYLPNGDFVAALSNGLGSHRIRSREIPRTMVRRLIARRGETHFAAEAMYWRAVSLYKANNDHTELGKVAEELRSSHPSSVWASKAILWLH